MNERIEELKKQAWEYTMAVHDGLVVPPPEKPVWPVDEVYDEKFAELIVRECLSIADGQKKQVEEMEVYNLQDEVWNRARIQQSQQIVDKIKQHFGVE